MSKLIHAHSITQSLWSHFTLVFLPLTFISSLLLLHTFDLLFEDFGQKLFKLVFFAQRGLEGGSQSLLSLLQPGDVSLLQFQLFIILLQLRLSGGRGEDRTGT